MVPSVHNYMHGVVRHALYNNDHLVAPVGDFRDRPIPSAFRSKRLCSGHLRVVSSVQVTV